MTTPGARRLVVARLRKPHGLKGECAVFPLTDHPVDVLAPGRTVWLVDLAGEVVAGPLQISRSREHHREWLVAFRGRDSRSEVEHWNGTFLAQEAEALTPPQGDEVYLDELAGFAVENTTGQSLGLVSGWFELPGGLTLEVQGPRREFLMPYKKEIVRQVDRDARKLVVELPPGLVDLG